jgi:hypothetical protein
LAAVEQAVEIDADERRWRGGLSTGICFGWRASMRVFETRIPEELRT